MHFQVYTIHFEVYTIHFQVYTIHLQLYTIHLQLYTIHIQVYTIHFPLIQVPTIHLVYTYYTLTIHLRTKNIYETFFLYTYDFYLYCF